MTSNSDPRIIKSADRASEPGVSDPLRKIRMKSVIVPLLVFFEMNCILNYFAMTLLISNNTLLNK